MRPEQRVVTRLPLQELWDSRGPVPAQHVRDLSAADIRALLRGGPVRFVVVDVGRVPEWVAEAECFTFWKRELQPHLADPDQQGALQEFSDEYCYLASEWSNAGGSAIVVLQRCH